MRLEDAAEAFAAAALPDEVDIAAPVAAAWTAGGAQREQLFRSGGSAGVAAFGVGELAAVMPAVLAAVATVGAGLISTSSDAVVVVDALRRWRGGRASPEPGGAAGAAGTPAGSEGTGREEPAAGVKSGAPRGLDPEVLAVIDRVRDVLADHGVPEDRCAEVSLDVMAALYRAPAEAQALIEAAGQD